MISEPAPRPEASGHFDLRSEQARVLSDNSAATNGYWRNLGISVGRNPPDAEAARDYRAMLQSLNENNPGGVGMITIVLSSSTPTPEGRDMMIRMYKDSWPNLRAAAFVLEARGFAAATQRGMLSALVMASRLKQIKIFDSIDSACPWLAASLADTHTPASVRSLERAMHTVVRRFADEHR